MSNVLVALVGCGRISKRQIEAIGNTEGIEICAVCDIDEVKAQATGEKLGVPWCTDFRTIEGADVISVMPPSGLHPMHVTAIAENCTAPYIVCEKPVSLTVREAVGLFNTVEKEGKTLLPVFQNRYNPLVQHIHSMVAAGSLGTLHQYVCNIFWNRNNEYFEIGWHGTKDLDGGVLFTQASHYVDMLLYLFGPIAEAKGLGGSLRKLDVQDTVSAVCRHETGLVGSLNATVSTYRQNYQTEFTLIGSRGTVRLSGTNLNKVDFWDVESSDRPDIDFSLNHIYGKGHDFMYQYIVEKKWEMFPDLSEVLAGIELMERLSF